MNTPEPENRMLVYRARRLRERGKKKKKKGTGRVLVGVVCHADGVERTTSTWA